MALTVTPNLAELTQADSTTNFSASQGTPAADTDVYKEASASVVSEIRGAGEEYFVYTGITNVDLSNTHLYIWMACAFPSYLYSEAAGGIRIRVDDGTQWGDWVVGGSDTYDGGWKCWIIDTSRAFDYNQGGTDPTLTSIDEVGMSFDYASAGKNVESTFLDVMRYGDGITCHSASTDAVTWEDIYDYSSSSADGRAHGVIRRDAGVYHVQGKVRMGSGEAGIDFDFHDTAEVVVFDNNLTATDLQELIVTGNSTGDTEVKFGELSGGRGISGFTFMAESGERPFDVTCDNQYIDVGFYGCSFNTADETKFPTIDAFTSGEAIDCSWIECGKVTPSTSTIQYCNFINAPGVSCVIDDRINFDMQDSNFINCHVGIELQDSGEYSFSDLVFTGCVNDVWNNSGGSVTISASGTCNVSSYSGENVTITNTKRHTLTSVVNGSEVTYVSGEGISGTALHHEESVTGNSTYYDYNYTGDFVVTILVNHLSYEPWQLELTLGSTDQSLPVSQVEDRVYSNP
jgi:hypothetical protein